MKKILIICAAAAFAGCGIYKPYTRPEVRTDGLYGDAESGDTATIGNISWQEMFTDPQLQALIEKALTDNTDMQSAHWRVKETEATLKSARLAYLPSFNFAPQGAISSFDNKNTTKTYNIPVSASWQIDLFNGLTNAKRKAKALNAQSKEYEQAVRTQLIANTANLYYTLLMLDSQYDITRQTAEKWRQSVEIMRAMKEAGMANEAAVAQYEGTYFSISASLHDLSDQIRQMEKRLTPSPAVRSTHSGCPTNSRWAFLCRCFRTGPTSARPSIRSCRPTTRPPRPARPSIPRSRWAAWPVGRTAPARWSSIRASCCSTPRHRSCSRSSTPVRAAHA